ncbi:class I adenylate-forming enzyme family protein [Gephyromycinifex aptenodytis]|uniref:class I adenylate-forming enzyme family protein n=1 Tax=Gephyromycinifex aptenodytis TaxID=2716227 RepID=UPI0014477ECA|nr:class I adenylate-forming enzyme family protein [Gephyromycinifex aptenodytis]
MAEELPLSSAPARLNLAGYCLGGHDEQVRARDGLIVVTDAEASPQQAQRWSFADLDRAVRCVAAGLLSLGLARGDRVMIRLGNTSEYALLHFGAMAAGLVSVPSSPQLTPGEAQFLLQDCGAAALALAEDLPVEADPRVLIIRARDVARWLAQEEPVDYADTAAQDPAFLVYTSGTTSKPKGVLHAHRSVWGRRPMYDGWYGISDADVMLHAGAFNWTYTLGVGLCDPWAVGASAIVYAGPPARSVWPRLIQEYRPTLFAAVPGLFRQILDDFETGPDAADSAAAAPLPQFASLRHGLVAGEALPSALRTRWEKASGKPLFEALGMSECSTFVSSSPSVPVKDGSPGRPQQGRRIAALPLQGGTQPVPTGQAGLLSIHRSDPGLMLGYWRRPAEEAATTRDEWFVSGDLVSFDEDGYLRYLGRHDDLMTAGGYRVSPAEVEEVLAAVPGVREVAVTQIVVRADVSVIAAFVVPEDGADQEHLRAALGEAAEERLARYKRPRQIVFLGSLPRTRNGKLLRRDLGLSG